MILLGTVDEQEGLKNLGGCIFSMNGQETRGSVMRILLSLAVLQKISLSNFPVWYNFSNVPNSQAKKVKKKRDHQKDGAGDISVS
jgi:hypothetical protein